VKKNHLFPTRKMTVFGPIFEVNSSIMVNLCVLLGHFDKKDTVDIDK